MSQATTNGVTVRVQAFYVPQRSSPRENSYFFAYKVQIENEGEGVVRLLSRHWVITDGEGQVREVRGLGVVGETPRLSPGEQFDYTSACPLTTPVGSMRGSYQMVTEEGERFDAVIAPFTLALPHALN